MMRSQAIKYLRLKAKLPLPSRVSCFLIWPTLFAGLFFSTLRAPGQCGGVITLQSSQSVTNGIYIRVMLCPPEAVGAGAGWRLDSPGSTNYCRDPYLSTCEAYITSTNVNLDFANIPNWDPPARRSIQFDPPSWATNPATPAILSNVCYLRLPNLLVSWTGSLSSTGFAGGPFFPSSVTYTLFNPGQTDCGLEWSILQQDNWLTFSSTNGFLGPLGSTTVTSTVNEKANALLAGNYTDFLQFRFTSSTTGTSGGTPVLTTLTVLPRVMLTSPQSLNDGSFQMTLSGLTGQNYGIFWSPDLFTWSNLTTVTNLMGTNLTGFTNVIDTQAIGYSRRFYRALQQ